MKKILLLLFSGISLFAFSQEENITFPSGTVNLRGTFSVPQGDGPFPAVILVHGSGPADRDATFSVTAQGACIYPGLVGNTVTPFKDIADYFSENGIAVLRYDKRSSSHPGSIDPVLGSPEDFLFDVENAIAYLKTRAEVDLDCIILAGHSQGSVLIPAVQNGKEDVAGLISLAGAVTQIDTVITGQFKRQFEMCAGSAFCGNLVAEESYTVFQDLRQETDPNRQFSINVPTCNFTFPIGYPTFWQKWIALGASVLKNYNDFGVPKLIIQGTDDFNVPEEEGHLFEAGLAPSTTQVNFFTGVNHLLTPRDVPSVSIDVLQTMVDWIKNVKTTSITEAPQAKDEQIRFLKNGNQLTIIFPNNKIDEVQIFDLTGRVIFKQKVSGLKQLEIAESIGTGVFAVSLFSKTTGVFSEKVFLE